MTNPTEALFAKVRHSAKCANGCLTDKKMLLTIPKLAQEARKSYRRLQGFYFLAQVITGARFVDGWKLLTNKHVKPPSGLLDTKFDNSSVG